MGNRLFAFSHPHFSENLERFCGNLFGRPESVLVGRAGGNKAAENFDVGQLAVGPGRVAASRGGLRGSFFENVFGEDSAVGRFAHQFM